MARSPRFGFDDTDPEELRLVSDDFDLYAPVFNDLELDGGGYDWESVAQHLAETGALDCADEIVFDSEASMFCAISKSRVALKGLEDAMRTTFRNKKRLAQTIRSASEAANAESAGRVFKYVVVLHFESYFEKFDQFFESLKFDSDREIIGGQGGGESTIWVRTDDADGTIALCKPYLNQFKLLDTVIIGSRESSIEQFTVHWPIGYKKKLAPIIEWSINA